MKKYILLLIVCQIGFGQTKNMQNDIAKIIKKEKGLAFNITPAVSYFGNSIKTHWDKRKYQKSKFQYD